MIGSLSEGNEMVEGWNGFKGDFNVLATAFLAGDSILLSSSGFRFGTAGATLGAAVVLDAALYRDGLVPAVGIAFDFVDALVTRVLLSMVMFKLKTRSRGSSRDL